MHENCWEEFQCSSQVVQHQGNINTLRCTSNAQMVFKYINYYQKQKNKIS